MSIPNPAEALDVFFDYLKSENLDLGRMIFEHYRSQPGKSPNDWLDDGMVTDWCERMDNHLVHALYHYLPHPNN